MLIYYVKRWCCLEYKKISNMFRKIVTELVYSPALGDKVGEYSVQLRREKIRRETGMIFISLAVLMHLFLILTLSSQPQHKTPPSIVDDTLHSQEDILRLYDQNTRGIRDLMLSLGIDRTNLQNTKLTKVAILDSAYLWSLTETDDGKAHIFYSDDSPRAAYYQRTDSKHGWVNQADAYVGQSSTLGQFAILKDGGSLITDKHTPTSCVPISNVPIDDQTLTSSLCTEDGLGVSISAYNMTAKSPISTDREVLPSEHITYTLSVTNNSSSTITVPLNVSLSDALEYSQMTNLGGGNYDSSTQVITWGSTTVKPGAEIKRNFALRTLSTIPSLAQGEHNTESYDCTMSTSFGNTVNVAVECPITKKIEGYVGKLPSVSTGSGLIFAGSLFLISAYLYLRARQLSIEMAIIKRANSGGA